MWLSLNPYPTLPEDNNNYCYIFAGKINTWLIVVLWSVRIKYIILLCTCMLLYLHTHSCSRIVIIIITAISGVGDDDGIISRLITRH